MSHLSNASGRRSLARKWWFILIGLIAFLVMLGSFAWLTLPSPPAGLPPAAADHHLHIQGPAATAALKRMASHNLMLRSVSIFRPSLFHERGGRDALRVLDAAGIRQGVLLSNEVFAEFVL